MSVFNMMETFFFISLGITFVLILLLVYHFKQRIAATEQKTDTMFEIMNNVAEEMSGIKSTVISLMNRPSTPYPIHPPMQLDPSFSNFTHPVVSEESIMEGDDQSDSDSDYDSDSDNDDAKIIVSDDENDEHDEHDESTENNEHDESTENNEVIDINTDSTCEIVSETVDYNKMTLPVLKALVVEKGILEDASKMKKAKLVELIAQHSA